MKADQSDTKTVDAYIASFPVDEQKRLHEIRALIKKTLPKAIEDISYAMPAYRPLPGKRAIVFFAGTKNSVSTYALHFDTSPELLKKAQPYITTKSTMQFSNDKPMPIELIEELLLEKAVQYDLS